MALVGQGMRAGYGGKAVLDSLDLGLQAGEFVCVLGPNGAGKSTLARALVGLLGTDSVRLDGTPLHDWSPRERARRVGFLPQEVEPGFHFRVDEAVELGARVADPSSIEGAQDPVDQALGIVDAVHLRERPLDALSGGERRRVLLASVLAQRPRYLVLDEPTAMLDLEHQSKLFRAFRERADAGLGVLVVTHDINLAARWADRLLLLQAGRILAQGSAVEVLRPEPLQAVFGPHFELLDSSRAYPVVLAR